MREDTQPESPGADGGGRTHTLSRVPDFESGASANSATSATVRQYISSGGEVNKFPRAWRAVAAWYESAAQYPRFSYVPAAFGMERAYLRSNGRTKTKS